jgi:crotonobetainyl-CoA:carnitine CoA-transferase CaiB-like acyl-CoA transferase
MALEYDRYWKPFAETVLQRPDLADDPRFCNQMAGFQNAEALAALIDEAFGQWTEEQIVSRLKQADIAHEINLLWKEIRNDATALENGFIFPYGCQRRTDC